MLQARTDGELRIPVRDRVLLHLMDYGQYRESLEVPVGMSQAGLAISLGVDRSQVTRALQELKRRDMVEERVTYVTGAPRRCKVYALAMPGEAYCERLRELLLGQYVRFTDAQGQPASARLETVREAIGGELSFSRFMAAVLERRIILQEWYRGKLVKASIIESPQAVAAAIPVGEDMPDGSGPVEAAPSSAAEGTSFEHVTGSPFYDIGPPPVTVPDLSYGPPPPEEPSSGGTYPQGRGIMTGFFEQPTAVPKAQEPSGGYAVDGESPEKSLHSYEKRKMGLLIMGSAAIYMSLLTVGLLFERSIYNYASYNCCCGSSIMLLFGVVTVALWSISHESASLYRLLGGARMTIIVLATGAFALLFWVISQAIGPRLDIESALALLLVCPPLYALLILTRKIPTHIRAEAAASSGTFLMLAPLVALFDPSFFGLNPSMLCIFMILGAGLLLMGREMGNLWGAETIRASSPGIGAVMMAVPLTTAWLLWPPDGFTFAVMLALALFGTVLLTMPFIGARRAIGFFRPLGRSLLVCAGAALLFLGASLAARRIYAGAAEVLFALPVMYYGYQQFLPVFKEDRRNALAVLALALTVEMLAMARLLWFF